MKLFDDIKRQDFNDILKKPQPHQKNNNSSNHYLNYYDSPDITDIRNLLESSFNNYPFETQKDLLKRFQSPKFEQHEGAFFELFLHHLLSSLGCTIADIHPTIPGNSSHPDFLVRHGDKEFYLEATVVGKKSGPFTNNRNAQIVIEHLNTLKSPDFYIGVNMEGTLSKTLSKSTITRRFDQLLKKHNPDDVQHIIDNKGTEEAPFATIEEEDWILQGWLCPISPENRGNNHSRQIVITPYRAKWINSGRFVRDKIVKKAKKYKNLPKPLIIAVGTRDMFYHPPIHDMEVLFGQEHLLLSEEPPHSPPLRQRKLNGVWPSHNQITAVWSFQKADALNLPQVSACLYVNPWKAPSVLPDILYRLTYAEIYVGELNRFQGKDIAQLLGMSKN